MTNKWEGKVHLFYTPEVTPEQLSYQLSEEESKHAVRVLRLNLGDVVFLIDGKGGLFEAEIAEAHPKRTKLQIVSYTQEYGRSSYRLHLAVAPTKSMDRFEWFLEKGTEIGVHEITPLLGDHSERKEIKTDRLNKIVVAAAKQSLKAYVPRINPMVSIDSFLDNLENNQQVVEKGIAHCEKDTNKEFVMQAFKPHGDYLLMIGPEGDFSPREVRLCLSRGFTPISLGESRLRTETAAVLACAEVALLNR